MYSHDMFELIQSVLNCNSCLANLLLSIDKHFEKFLNGESLPER